MTTTDDHRAAPAAGNPGPAEPGAPTWKKSVVRDYFESICIAVVFALFVRTFVVQAFKIPSSSMEENLLIGDHILVNKFAYGARPAVLERVLPYREVAREDVVVFKYPVDASRDFIKRVIAIGGDTIAIRQGQVILNDQPLAQEYITVKSPYSRVSQAEIEHEFREGKKANLPPQRIRDRELWVMGDNRMNSEDSRFWGNVPDGFVKGKALLIYWSFDVPDANNSPDDASVGEKATNLAYVFRHFISRSRWDRTFKVID